MPFEILFKSKQSLSSRTFLFQLAQELLELEKQGKKIVDDMRHVLRVSQCECAEVFRSHCVAGDFTTFSAPANGSGTSESSCQKTRAHGPEPSA